MKTVQIPGHVDDQPMILFWEMDEVAVGSMFFIIGYVMRELTICIVLAFIMVKLFQGWKNNQLNGVLVHMSYKFGWWRLNEVFKNGNIKEWIS
ncbi:type IV conjugative transfer system protein TraL [Acidithiobacillus sp. HP-6]|uniref:type IV conjugative transfer system protein TraL n=1 Tax=unclassified Acidithiobacillus TaxID=2614800 RepID=UPI0018790FB6|nr:MULTISPECIES: type IV conjugative transfer system protein TraL [unclassified Acidithiobacillus]MBE7562209.1 type IV conjugative transfer system protein TraL [Acidithiobacillus sp. HP-6]MBE7568934.1 type IV conjugative transfer system protein TraL [Acidithiobacillus sp. HP-2]